MKRTQYDLFIRQKRDGSTIGISYENIKKIKYKYQKKNKHFKATLTSFKGGKTVVEYSDVISVKKEKYKI